MKAYEFHIGGQTVYVGYFPYTERPALGVTHGNTVTKLALFGSYEAAWAFVQILASAFGNPTEVALGE